MISVLYIHTRFASPGGANYVAVETANRLAERPEFQMSIATAEFNRELYSLHPDVHLHEFGGGSPGRPGHWAHLPRILRDLADLIAEQDIDIVVYHSIPTPYWTIYLKRRAQNVDFLWYAHDPNSYLNLPGKLADVPPVLRAITKLSLPLVRRVDRYCIQSCLDGVIANSEFTKDVLNEVYGIDSVVIYPGVEVERFERNPQTDVEGFFTIGQLNRYKNFDVLIRAMARLDAQIENPPSLTIGGTGQWKAELEKVAHSEGVSSLVRFAGQLDEGQLIDHYSSAITTVYLPENEPFGLVPVESMAAGTPVVAINSGGIRETVIDGETGILLTELSPSSVAAALNELSSNPDTRTEMGTTGRKRVESEFTIEQTVDSLAHLYRQRHADGAKRKEPY